MNQTIRELMERKSVRAYTGESIGKEEKEMILRAAMEAPTAGNQQLYTILDITDPALKRELADLRAMLERRDEPEDICPAEQTDDTPG